MFPTSYRYSYTPYATASPPITARITGWTGELLAADPLLLVLVVLSAAALPAGLVWAAFAALPVLVDEVGVFFLGTDLVVSTVACPKMTDVPSLPEAASTPVRTLVSPGVGVVVQVQTPSKLAHAWPFGAAL